MDGVTRTARASLLAAAAIGLVATASCGDAMQSSAAVSDLAVHRLERRDLTVTVTEKGTLKAKRQTLIRSRIPGQAKIIELIEEGSTAAAGDVLCKLDATERKKERETLENRVIQLEADVTAAKAELEIQLSQNEADIADQKLQVKFAEVELERFEKGDAVQERTKLEVRIEETKSDRDRAINKYEEMPQLLEEGFVTADQVEEERIKKIKAEGNLQLAELALKTYDEYTYPTELERRKSDVASANAEVERIVARAGAREAQKRSNLRRQEGELRNVRERLAEVQAILDNMVITAPTPGLVIYGDGRGRNDSEIKVGETVYANRPFLTLPDLTEMEVTVSVHEADIARIKEGLAAHVRVETLRGDVLAGVVSKVAPVAASSGRRWYDDTKRFEVEIALEGDISSLGLKPGLSAKVDILVDKLEGVLALPSQAVFSQDGKFHAFVRRGGVVSRAQIEIGEGNAQYVVVTSGLEEGDDVLLYNPEAAADGGATQAAPTSDGEEADGAKSGRPGKP